MAKKQHDTAANDQNRMSDADIAKLSYEDAIERLESLIDRIESGDIGLEASVTAYEEGMALKKHCEAIHAKAEQRVRELTADETTTDNADTTEDDD